MNQSKEKTLLSQIARNLAIAVFLICTANFSMAQNFINGSFENTTATVACNYNLNNATFNSLMSNVNAYGGGNEMDIIIAGCFNPTIPDGIRAVCLAHVPEDEIAIELTAPLVPGNTYTFTFDAYNAPDFSPQGDLEIGASTVNNAFGTQIYVAATVPSVWNTYTVTFVAPNAAQWITVRNMPGGAYWNHVDNFQFTNVCDPGWTPPSPVCSTDPAINLDGLITGDTGGTWSGTGVTGNTFDPSSGTQTITYTAPGGCDSIAQIVVTPTATATWTIPTNLCDSDAPFDLSTFVTGTPGGTWSGTGVTGTNFDPSVGTQSITYTVGTAPCDDAVTQTITVGTQASAAWTPPAGLCTSGGSVDLNTTITGTTGGTWSGTGVTGSMFDPSVGTQTITYTVGTAPCDDVSTQTINVATTTSAAWTIPTGLCESDAPIDLSTFITGDPGGTWSGTGITGAMFDPSVGTQSITYSVGTAPCDDIVTQTITVATIGNAAWTPPSPVCEDDADIDLNTLITGDPGGTWSGTGVTGNMFDPSVGTQTITYDVGAPCNGTSAQTITVTPNGDASWTIPTNICIGDAPFDLNTYITGTTGGTWSGTGVTGSMFDPSVGTQSITYTVGTAPCDDAVTQTITVATALDASWTVPTGICETDAPFDLSTFITGDAGGTWSGTGVTGTMFDPSVGTQTITYTVGTGGCQATSAQSVSVDVTPDPSWTTLTTCISGSAIDLNTTITGTTGGTWSGTGVTGSNFDPSVGTQALTYTVTSGACTASSTQSVTVLDPTPSTTPTHVSCFGLTDGAASTTMTGGSGNYTYSWNPSGQTGANPSGLGAGTYMVTITDVDANCSVMDSVTILEPSEIVLNMTGLDACAPEMGTAMVQASGGSGVLSYDWGVLSSTTNTVTNVDSAMATVVVTDANGCTATDSVFVNVWPLPITTITNDTTIYSGDFIQLNTSGGVMYEWTPSTYLSCDDCANPVATPEDPTTYCVNITDTRGCQVEECVLIDIEIICGDVFVPSAFSPNEDGENDELCVYSDCMESLTFTIYNRWGEKVYETSNMQICWDGTWKGKPLNSAVFVYVLDGYLINGQTITQKGNISLIR